MYDQQSRQNDLPVEEQKPFYGVWCWCALMVASFLLGWSSWGLYKIYFLVRWGH